MTETSDPSQPGSEPPAGWYPLSGELRWWDGRQWTEHRQPAPAPTPQPLVDQGWASAPNAYPMVLTDARTSSTEIVVAWVLAVLTGLYMLPWAIAATRGKSNSVLIALVNFFLGWTVIGWVAALVMACLPHKQMSSHPF